MDTINFKELQKLNDSEFMVIMGLLLDDDSYESTIDSMNYAFKKSGLIRETDKVIKLIFVSGNIEGEKGRHDWIIEFSKGTQINPLKRLLFDDIKWISDFIVNSKLDYEYN